MSENISRVALLIGIESYEVSDSFPALRSVSENIKELKKTLEDSEVGDFTKVVTLVNPSFQEIKSKIEEVFEESRKEESLIFLYYCGHGLYKEHGSHIDFCLTGRDSKQRDSETLIKGEFLRNKYELSQPRQMILVVDCCHSELVATSFFDLQHQKRAGKGGRKLSNEDEEAYKHIEKCLGDNFKSPDQNKMELVSGEQDKNLYKEIIPSNSTSFQQGVVVITSCGESEKADALSNESKLSAFTHFLVDYIRNPQKENIGDWRTVHGLYWYIRDKFEESRQHGMTPYICHWGSGRELPIAKVIDEEKAFAIKELSLYIDGGEFLPIGEVAAKALLRKKSLTEEEVERRLKRYRDRNKERIDKKDSELEQYRAAVRAAYKLPKKKKKANDVATENYLKDKRICSITPKEAQQIEAETCIDHILEDWILQNWLRKLIIIVGVLLAGPLTSVVLRLHQIDSEYKTRLQELRNLLIASNLSKCIEQAEAFPINSAYSEQARAILETCKSQQGILSSRFLEAEGTPVRGLSVTPSTGEVVLVRPTHPEIWQISSKNRLSSYAGFFNQGSKYLPQAVGFYQASNSQSFDTLLVFIDSNQQLKLHNISDGQISNIPFIGSISSDSPVAISRNGKVLVIVQGSVIRIFDISLNESQRQYVVRERQKSLITSLLGAVSLALSSNGSIVTIGGSTSSGSVQRTSLNEADSSQQGAVEVWDVDKGERIKELVEYSSQVTAVSISADGSRIVSGSAAGKIKVWGLPSLRTNQTIKPVFTAEIQDEVRAIAISPTGNLIAISSANKTELFSIVEGSKPQELDTRVGLSQTTPIDLITFTADGNALIGGGVDGRLIMWQWSNNR